MRLSVSSLLAGREGPWGRYWARLAGKGFWAVMDQGTFALSNFALNVLLARWLSPQDFGAFTISYTVFLFLGSFHNGLLSEPVLVYGSGKYRDDVPAYLGALVYGHFAFSAAGSLLLLLGGVALALSGSGALFAIFLVLALVAPFVLLQRLVRQACYIRLQPRLAASAGAAYMVLITAGAYVLYRGGWLSGATALGAMGASSLVVSAWLALRLGVRLPPRKGGLVARVFGDHWRYGRWAVPTRVFTYIPGNIFYLVLPVWGGLAASGGLKALMNMIMPVLQAYAALTTLMLPLLSRARGTPEFGRLVRTGLGVFVCGATLYWLALGLTHRWLTDLLYDGRYVEYSALLWLLGLLPVLAGALGVLGSALRARERPDRMFWAYAFTTATAVTAGLGCVAAWGLGGAVVGLLLSSCVTTAAAAIFYRRTTDDEARGARDETGD